MRQTTWLIDWSTTPATDYEVELPPRAGRWAHLPHLDECFLFTDPDQYCTCDDDSPEWTI